MLVLANESHCTSYLLYEPPGLHKLGADQHKLWCQANPCLNPDSTTLPTGHYLCDLDLSLLTCKVEMTILHIHRVGRIKWNFLSQSFSMALSAWKGPFSKCYPFPFGVLWALVCYLPPYSFFLWIPPRCFLSLGKLPNPRRKVSMCCFPSCFT